jgi:hypothetical protein
MCRGLAPQALSDFKRSAALFLSSLEYRLPDQAEHHRAASPSDASGKSALALGARLVPKRSWRLPIFVRESEHTR